eukprot:1177454-Prorocentrum_minimum.AAC.1
MEAAGKDPALAAELARLRGELARERSKVLDYTERLREAEAERTELVEALEEKDAALEQGREVGESGELDKAVRKGGGKLGVLSAAVPLLAQERTHKKE